MPFASSEGDARAYGIRQLGLFGRGGVDSRQSASESPPWMAAGHLAGGNAANKHLGGDMRKLVFADSKGSSEGGSNYGKAFLASPASTEKSYSPAIRATALGQSPSVRHMRARQMRPVVFAEEHEERVFQSSLRRESNSEDEEEEEEEEDQDEEGERTPEKEPVTPGPRNSNHFKTPSRTPKHLKSASKDRGLLHEPLTPGGVASPTAVHLFQQFFAASPGFYEEAERLKTGAPLSPGGAPLSPGGVGLAQRRPVLGNKSRLHDGAAASGWGSPDPRTPGKNRSPGGAFAGSPESPFVVRSQYCGSPGGAASPFVVRSQFPSPGGEESPYVFRSACKSGMGDSYYPGMNFTVDSSPFAEQDTELKTRRHLLAEEGGSGVAFEMEEMFENRFLEAARNAAGVGAASPASSSVCSLVIEYDSDEDDERKEIDPRRKLEMEERLANPVFTVAKPGSGSRLDDAEGSPPRAEGAQRRLFASPGRNKQPKTPRRVKVGASRFGIRRSLRDAQGAATTMSRGAWGELQDEEDEENQEPRLETPKAPGGPLPKVFEDQAHSGNTQEDPRTEYRPPPQAKGALQRMQRPDSASRPMFRRCKSSNDRPGSAPRQPLHLSQQNIGSQDDTGPLFAPRRPSQPFPGSQRPGSSSSSSRRQWRPTSSNGEIPEVPPEEAEALDRRNAMRPSPNQRPQSAMAAPSLGVIGRSLSTNERGRNGGRIQTPLQGGGGGLLLPPIKMPMPSGRDAAGDREKGTGSTMRLPNINEKPETNRRRLPF